MSGEYNFPLHSSWQLCGYCLCTLLIEDDATRHPTLSLSCLFERHNFKRFETGWIAWQGGWGGAKHHYWGCCWCRPLSAAEIGSAVHALRRPTTILRRCTGPRAGGTRRALLPQGLRKQCLCLAGQASGQWAMNYNQ